MPQKMHRSSSSSNFAGYFSRSSQGLSAASMWMQLAGQIVGHIMQATHLTRPSSSRLSRWTPR